MRTLLVIPLILASTAARAEDITYTPFVEVRAVDAPCRAFAEVPPTATTLGPSYDAAISTASCMVSTRTRSLRVDATADSVAALDAAVAPALAILDRVIRVADTEHKLIAYYVKADILSGNTARLLATLPEISPQVTSKEVRERAALVRSADALTLRWRQRALASRREIVRLAGREPDIVVRNPIVARMVVETRLGPTAGVAAR
ncbi:MAG: hypothetical protein ACM31C_00455 [Acidobacteriota bacterium]